jgi:hypothetical protein
LNFRTFKVIFFIIKAIKSIDCFFAYVYIKVPPASLLFWINTTGTIDATVGFTLKCIGLTGKTLMKDYPTKI